MANHQNTLITQFKQTYDCINTPVFFVAFTDYLITLTNTSATKISGYSSEELIHRSFFKLFVETDQPRVHAMIEAGKQFGIYSEFSLEMMRKSGRTLIINLSGKNHTIGDEKWIAFTLNDVTGLQNAHDKLEEKVKVRTADLKEANTLLKLEIEQRILAEKTIFTQRDQLVSSAKMKALGQMASGIAHEINNPLAIILSSAEIINSSLAQNPSDIPKSIKYAQKISNTTLRIGRIVKALLNFAREGDPVVFSLVRVAKLFEDTLDLCRERFKTHHIELRTSIPGEDMQIECHAVQITQVLLNILNNAHDTLEELNDKWVELKAHDGGEFIEIRVTDSGHGIPVAIREKLFDPFFTTKEVGRGTGLGLSISKGIVDLHQGSLFIDVEKSNTCFVIRLPKAQPRK